LSDSVTALSRLTGAQILVEYLVRQGVPFAAGSPGHGCWAISDALLDRQHPEQHERWLAGRAEEQHQ
jgi:thiamine pyrophosphate-dependent acetolactate synthase large subunit-like protein